MSTIKLFNNHIKSSFAVLAVVETFLFLFAVYAAVAIRFQTFNLTATDASADLNYLFSKAVAFAALNMLGMTALGLYQIEQFRGQRRLLQTIARVLTSFLLVFVMLVMLYYMLPFLRLGRGLTALAFLLGFSSVILLRRFFYYFMGNDVFVSRVLVYGVGHAAAGLLPKQEEGTPSYKIVGFISTPQQTRLVPESMVVELGDSLARQARALNVNEIVIALDDRNETYPVQHLLDCKLSGIAVTDPISFLEREQGKVNLAQLNIRPSWMVFNDGFRGSRLKTAFSRLFDVVASLTILVVMSPVLLLVALLIGAEGKFKEPVFYRQQRVGKNGEIFNLLKFRSMRVDAERDGAQWASQNDARVTRTGKIIRKLRIDELPQIINILKGDMRLVGPRPERPEFVQRLSKVINYYSQRHSVKPGLAGWAQLKYPYGASEEDAYEKLQYDLYYVKNANPVMDFFILLQTLEVVLFGKGVR